MFLFFTSAALVRAADFQVTASWNDNASNSDRESDAIGALQLQTELSAERRGEVTRDLTYFYGARARIEAWPRFQGLDRAEAGPTVALRQRFGLGAFAPTLTLAASGTLSAARESGRAGPAGALSLTYGQRVTSATRFAATVEGERLDARDPLFARSGVEGAFLVVHDLNELWRFNFTARWRSGVILAHATPPRPDIVEIARTRANNETFDRSFVAYSIKAHSVAFTAGISRALDERSSLRLEVEWRDSSRASFRYLNRLVSLSYAHQF